ncbi:MAG: hypothetical protein LAO55_21670 [Acidobacteriia bacterium]|nr:hypothetical protein [Terriglobia bacterium]
MQFSDWLDMDGLKVMSQHLSSTLASLLAFGVVGWVLKLVLRGSDFIELILERLEQVVLVGLVLWFTIQLAVLLWKKSAWMENVQNGPVANILVI